MQDPVFETLRHYILDRGYNVYVEETTAAIIQNEIGEYFDIDYTGKYEDRPYSLNRKYDVPFSHRLRAEFWERLYRTEITIVDELLEAIESFKKTVEAIR